MEELASGRHLIKSQWPFQNISPTVRLGWSQSWTWLSSLVFPATGLFHTYTVLRTVNICEQETTGSFNKMSAQFAAELQAAKVDFLLFWTDTYNEMSRQFMKRLCQLNKLFLMRRQDWRLQPLTGAFGWDIEKISSCICGNNTRYFFNEMSGHFAAENLGIWSEMSG